MMTTKRYGFLVLVSAVVVVGLSFGMRQSFGLFMLPITLGFDWDRTTLSIIIAFQVSINGLVAPIAAAVSDKWGTGRTVLAGGIAYGCGLYIMSQSVTPVGMMIGGGLLVGMGISACGMPVLFSAVAKVAPDEKRSLWLGIVTAGATGGQLMLIPAIQSMITGYDWSFALKIMALVFVIVIPVSGFIGLAGRANKGR